MHEITVLVADDEPLLRQAYTLILNADPEFRVVGEACDGREAVKKYDELRPDVVIMDLRMPRLSGVEATAEIMGSSPQARILVVTSMTTEEYLAPALANGASGYLTKDTDGDRLKQALRDVAAGTVALGPVVAEKLVRLVVQNRAAESALAEHETSAPASRPAAAPLAEPLTPREQSVLDLLAEGLTNQEMSERLFLSDSTVKANLARVMHKLGASNRVQALVLAVRQGLVTIGE